MTIRPAAVAGTWYPANPHALANEVDGYVAAAGDGPSGTIAALIAPHAGIMFSGPVAAFAYRAAARREYDVAVLVGPSHFMAYEGVALFPDGAFASPFGPIAIDEAASAAIGAAEIVRPFTDPHAREHSLEMQLPFVGRLLPGLPIVPLLMGHQRRARSNNWRTRLLTASARAARCSSPAPICRTTSTPRRPRSSTARCADASRTSVPNACRICSSAIPLENADVTSAVESDRRLP